LLCRKRFESRAVKIAGQIGVPGSDCAFYAGFIEYFCIECIDKKSFPFRPLPILFCQPICE